MNLEINRVVPYHPDAPFDRWTAAPTLLDLKAVGNETFDWQRDIGAMFVSALFVVSAKRRINASGKGLGEAAARMALETPRLILHYRLLADRVMLGGGDADYERLASQLAHELVRSPQVMAETHLYLNNAKRIVFHDERITQGDAYLIECGDEETATTAFEAALDYLGHFERVTKTVFRFKLRCLLTSYIRVGNYVFNRA